MSRAFEDEQDKQARMEAARKYYNGEKKCDNCGHLFYPNENDPEQFVCNKCIKHAMDRD
ncbi:hypothetical protein IGK54_000802 [Enterococcus sp. DIV2384]